MKNMLLYQSSEYDCGPTTLTNALRFLYHRDEIPPALLKGIWAHGNDTFNECGETGKHGTSKDAMRYLSSWFNAYAKGWSFPLKTRYLEGREADVTEDSPIVACLREGGAALLRCYTGGYGHFVLLTKLLPEGIGLFDPYEDTVHYRLCRDGICPVYGCPREMNRIVTMERLNRFTNDDYASGETEKREQLLFWRTEP